MEKQGKSSVGEEAASEASKDARKPKYAKPEIIATYSEKELQKEFGNLYGQSFVDLFG